jgi:hypothetical protein
VGRAVGKTVDEKAEGRRQRAEGRKQKAESRRQRAEGRRQKAEDRSIDEQTYFTSDF